MFDKTDIAHRLDALLVDDVAVKNCSVSSNNISNGCTIDHRQAIEKGSNLREALLTMLLYKSTILTHQWSSLE